MDIKQGFDSNYRYVLVAARRARQLQSGSQPLVNARSGKACRVAQEELDAGLVGYQDKAKPVIDERLPSNTFAR
jgi:DNA-directed RNA polymerase subunit omega